MELSNLPYKQDVSKLISIIIPVKNRENEIFYSLKSVQTLRSIAEIIIINDHSTDGTVELLKQHSHLFDYLENSIKEGAPAARNFGAARATTDLFWFLDSDDICLPDGLVRLIDIARKSNEDEINFCDFIRCKPASSFAIPVLSDLAYNWRKISHKTDKCDLYHLLWHNPITSCTIYPRKAFQNAGGFNETYSAGQERDLNIRLALLGYKFKPAQDIAYIKIDHTGNRIGTKRRFDTKFEATKEFQSFGAHFPSYKALFRNQKWALHMLACLPKHGGTESEKRYCRLLGFKAGLLTGVLASIVTSTPVLGRFLMGLIFLTLKFKNSGKIIHRITKANALLSKLNLKGLVS